MSYYSGFPSKSEESIYNRNIAHLIQLLQTHLLKYLTGEALDVVYWTKSFTKVFKTAQNLESQKTNHPKFSVYCTELADYFGVYSAPSTALRHKHDITFIEEKVLPPLEPIIERPRKVYPRTRHNSSTPNPPSRHLLEPKYYKSSYRKVIPPRSLFKNKRTKSSASYNIYQNRAMWKLNNDMMAYI